MSFFVFTTKVIYDIIINQGEQFMKSILVDMIEMYKIKDYDWMGFKIDNISDLTFHHIIKAENGGDYSLENGAILTKKAHDFLHCIEGKNHLIYDEINILFKIINTKKGIDCEDELMLIRNLILNYINMNYGIPRNMKRGKIKRMILTQL